MMPMAKHLRPSQLRKLIAAPLPQSAAHTRLNARCFSVLNRPSPRYEGHIPLTIAERLGLALGSGLGSFIDPRRAGVYGLSLDSWGSY
jgi:ubiquinone biosynthesis protein COQ4